MTGWRTALWIAWRTARRSPGRTVLIAALIGVPVAAAVFLAILLRTTNPSGERLADIEMGTADAAVQVTEYSSVRLEPHVWGSELSWQPRSEKTPTRPTDDVDVPSLLPAGTTVTPVAETSASVTVDGVRATYDVRLLDGTLPLNDGRFRLEAGRMPAEPGEVAVSDPLATRYGWSGEDLKAGAALTTTDGQRYTVTGIASPIRGIGYRIIWAPPGSQLFANGQEPQRYLADLPADADVAALQRSLARTGVVLTPRATVVDPPSDSASGWEQPQMVALLALFVGFGVLEIVLLAGAAFAVGARRQVRELGLVGAQGGTARDVRRIVLAQGLVLGAVGSVAGAVAGAGVAVAGRPLWERATDMAITGWDFPIVVILAVVAIGIVAGLGAAIVPARTAYRMPVVAALNARFHAESLRTRIPLWGVLLVAAGIAAVAAGSALLGSEFAAQTARYPNGSGSGSGVTPTGPIALVLLGITLVVAGLVWILPRLVATVARIGAAMPLSVRLALRDAGRHRHRTGPAAAAIMMAVAASVAMSYALANQLADDKRHYVPVTRHGDAVLPVKSPADDPYQPAPTYSTDLLDRLTAELPVERTFQSGALFRPATPGSATISEEQLPGAQVTTPGGCGVGCMSADPVRVIDPAMLGRLAGDAARDETAALRAGNVVVASADSIRDGTVRVDLAPEAAPRKRQRIPAVVATGLPRTELTTSPLISPETARRLGDVRIDTITFALSREPTGDELAAAARITGYDDALRVERGFEDYGNMAMLIVLGAAGVVTLLGTGISIALSAAEGRANLATLAAVGAQPGRRRRLAAAQAWLIGELGCLLGIGVGSLYGYTAHVAIGSPYLAVPWTTLAGIAVAVPLFAAILAWLLTRSRLPMIRRVE
ncbi:FtsX-like permease family protein [Haloechinothrix halophila]|uniref:FtsX-like permease family protein n=1 Tax=Haloechinothrix halophila TaxID=1069073 RepID=UPI000407D363|nr:FtsX-like permease family protein [Haloechinothrix halophila]